MRADCSCVCIYVCVQVCMHAAPVKPSTTLDSSIIQPQLCIFVIPFICFFLNICQIISTASVGADSMPALYTLKPISPGFRLTPMEGGFGDYGWRKQASRETGETPQAMRVVTGGEWEEKREHAKFRHSDVRQGSSELTACLNVEEQNGTPKYISVPVIILNEYNMPRI
jgi:hypothetical protein